MQNISTKSFFSELDSINPNEFIENYIDPSEKRQSAVLLTRKDSM